MYITVIYTYYSNVFLKIAAVAAIRRRTDTESVAAESLSCPSGDNTATIDLATDGELLITEYVRRFCVVPRTVENFERLIAAGMYDNTSIYRIVLSLTFQMGGGSSGGENFRIIRTVPGIVAMVCDRLQVFRGQPTGRFTAYSAFGIVTQPSTNS